MTGHKDSLQGLHGPWLHNSESRSTKNRFWHEQGIFPQQYTSTLQKVIHISVWFNMYSVLLLNSSKELQRTEWKIDKNSNTCYLSLFKGYCFTIKRLHYRCMETVGSHGQQFAHSSEFKSNWCYKEQDFYKKSSSNIENKEGDIISCQVPKLISVHMLHSV